MGYHHLALAARDMKAIHDFYEGVMGFQLVKVEVGPSPEGGWAKHFFYRMEDDSKFIAFWEMHDMPGTENVETNLSKAAGVPDHINHISFDVKDMDELQARKQRLPVMTCSRSTITGATRSTPRTRTTISSSSA
ncbi:catechol 2,3-dioxygenase-like lactoylglutathione lyase family enzyme [Parvibaculum indicum]|uniref:VOC family protein n=1 Tax=Parvibaculum indicum TaxID=562969 RepID=UPI00196355AA|nr:VOC family protein [Parvibaculum indicum]NIJ40818.1 catechol 2,3-dioxygenase-like lactoylglutathione lyase family enzyme [Parvibaculum indicum]